MWRHSTCVNYSPTQIRFCLILQEVVCTKKRSMRKASNLSQFQAQINLLATETRPAAARYLSTLHFIKLKFHPALLQSTVKMRSP